MHRSYTRKRLKIYNARLIVSIIKSLRIAPSNERYFANYCNALFIEITVLTNIYSIFLHFSARNCNATAENQIFYSVGLIKVPTEGSIFGHPITPSARTNTGENTIRVSENQLKSTSN